MKYCSFCSCVNPQNYTSCIECGQQFDQPVINYQHSGYKDKRATASLALSITAIGLALILLVPSFFVGGLAMSCASQPPDASGIDYNDNVAMQNYQRYIAVWGVWGLLVMLAPPMSSIILSVIAIVLGIKAKKHSRNYGVNAKGAVAGIVLSSIILGWAALAFLIVIAIFALAFLNS